MKRRVMAVCIGLLVAAQVAVAGSLSDKLRRPATGTSLAGQTSQLVAELLRTAVLGADFPTVASTPSVTYTFDPEVGNFVRSSSTLGPTFLERGETVGKGRFAVSLSYLRVDFTELNGESLDDLNLGRDFALAGGVVSERLRFDDFLLTSDVVAFSGTYGITDAWEVNAVAPLVYTRLDARGSIEGDAGRAQIDVDDSRFGIGDVILRTKYRVTAPGGPTQAAVGLALRLPTGDDEDFQGLDDWVVSPFLVVSRSFSIVDLHANLGVDANADDLERSRFVWGLGATIQAHERLGMLLEFFGDSGFADDEFAEFGTTGEVARSDNVFAAPGLKLQLWKNGTAFAGAVVPLTSDGLQADAIPVGGVEVTF